MYGSQYYVIIILLRHIDVCHAVLSLCHILLCDNCYTNVSIVIANVSIVAANVSIVVANVSIVVLMSQLLLSSHLINRIIKLT